MQRGAVGERASRDEKAEEKRKEEEHRGWWGWPGGYGIGGKAGEQAARQDVTGNQEKRKNELSRGGSADWQGGRTMAAAVAAAVAAVAAAAAVAVGDGERTARSAAMGRTGGRQRGSFRIGRVSRAGGREGKERRVGRSTMDS